MKYDPDAIFEEIMRRGDRLSKRKQARKTMLLSAAAFMLLTLSSGLIVTFSKGHDMPITDSYYGAFLLSPQAGGYVLIGLIAFALGAVFTILCKNLKDKNKKE